MVLSCFVIHLEVPHKQHPWDVTVELVVLCVAPFEFSPGHLEVSPTRGFPGSGSSRSRLPDPRLSRRWGQPEPRSGAGWRGAAGAAVPGAGAQGPPRGRGSGGTWPSFKQIFGCLAFLPLPPPPYLRIKCSARVGWQRGGDTFSKRLCSSTDDGKFTLNFFIELSSLLCHLFYSDFMQLFMKLLR